MLLHQAVLIFGVPRDFHSIEPMAANHGAGYQGIIKLPIGAEMSRALRAHEH